MNRLYLLSNSRLPILAMKFWKIPKFGENREEVFNKIVRFQRDDFYAVCYFSHKYYRTDKFEGNTIIKSNLEITYKEHKIEEECDLFEYINNEYIDINYALRNYITSSSKSCEKLVLKDKIEFSINLENREREIWGDFRAFLPNRTVELLGKIRNELDSHKDNFKVF